MTRIQLPIPAHALPGAPSQKLLAAASTGIAEAAQIDASGRRYATAHLAALRAAAAVLAARAEPSRTRGRAPSVWVLLPQVAPELADWAVHFAERSNTRAAVEAGIPGVVSGEGADAMVTAAQQFIRAVEVMLS